MTRKGLLTVYSKPDCHLCAEAVAVLRELQAELGFELLERDITATRRCIGAISSVFRWLRSTARSYASTSSTRRCCASV